MLSALVMFLVSHSWAKLDRGQEEFRCKLNSDLSVFGFYHWDSDHSLPATWMEETGIRVQASANELQGRIQGFWEHLEFGSGNLYKMAHR